jgi:hypothetical protein
MGASIVPAFARIITLELGRLSLSWLETHMFVRNR